VLVLEVAAGAGLVATSRVTPHRDTVPHVVGLQVLAANSALGRAGLTPEVSGEQYSAKFATGAVISQVPPRGVRMKPGAIVKMVISEGRHPTVLPSLPVSMSEVSVRTALQRAHLASHFSESYSETVPAGALVSWSSVAGKRVFYGDIVNVVISKGPAPQTIPSDLYGGSLTWGAAQAILTGLHLVAHEEFEYSNTITAGYVVTTSPDPGHTVPGHSTVLVFVSVGPPYVKVPLLDSDPLSTAEQKLTSLGLTWKLYGPPGADFILATDPGSGTSVRVGSTIYLFLGY
jgi:serine/threonine-protein kinase